jgi:hypothetical protein
MICPPKRIQTRHQWLTPTGAGALIGCSRATITAAVRRGAIRAFCEQCHRKLKPEELLEGHGCDQGPGTRVGGGYRVVLRPEDVQGYKVDEVHRAAGLASGKSKAKLRKASAA